MDDNQFDGLTRSLSIAANRRAALGALAGAALGVALSRYRTADAAGKCLSLGTRCDKRRSDPCCGGGECRNGLCQCPAETFEINGACFFQAVCEPHVVTCAFRCGNAPGRGVRKGCFCGTTVDDKGLCFRNGRFCERTCASSADCPAGQACFKSDCASAPGTCFAPCPGKRLIV